MRDTRGITLISLVITIIVLLILAGISIVILVGKDGILAKAKLTKVYSRKSEAQEYLEFEIENIRIDKQGNISLKNLLIEFNKEEREDITVVKVEPQEEPTEITVIVKEYEEFSFTIGEKCTIIKVCGIDVEHWAGETVDSVNKITIKATPGSHTQNSMNKQEVTILVNSLEGFKEWSGKYAFNKSKTIEPEESEWKSLTLQEGKNDKEKIGQVQKSASEEGEYYLWVQITTNGYTAKNRFGPYKLASVPTESNLVCILKSKSENDTKGKLEVGSNQQFEGWKLTYMVNNNAEIEIENGKTIEIDVIQNDYIEVKYSKEGQIDVIKTLKITELKEEVTASLLLDNIVSSNYKNDLTKGTQMTLTSKAQSEITSIEVKIGNYTVYSEVPSNTTNYSKIITIDSLILNELKKLEFNEKYDVILKIITKNGTEKTSNRLEVTNYTVGTPNSLNKLATVVNNGTNLSLKLIYQIDNISATTNFMPIGYYNGAGDWTGPYFAGTFDGNSKTVTITSVSPIASGSKETGRRIIWNDNRWKS